MHVKNYIFIQMNICIKASNKMTSLSMSYQAFFKNIVYDSPAKHDF